VNPKVMIIYSRDIKTISKWMSACSKAKIEYTVNDIFDRDWLRKITESNPNVLLLRPPGAIEQEKNLYDEKIYILSKILGYFTFPSYEECIIYENKKMLSYYLEANKIPHPKSWMINHHKDSMEFVRNVKYPIVFKSSIGASGSGVVIAKNCSEAKQYINRAFSNKGIPVRIGPNRVTGSPLSWLKKAVKSPRYCKQRLSEYRERSKNRSKNYVIIQEYIPHDFEWRVAKIGKSYFAHKKIKIKDKCSGTKGIDYVTPPEELLNFVKDISEKNNILSAAFDLFEYQGSYLVNEIQAIFGHVQDHICEFNGKPGRYLYKDNQWIFEEGNFNTNESYDLRLEVAIDLYKEVNPN